MTTDRDLLAEALWEAQGGHYFRGLPGHARLAERPEWSRRNYREDAERLAAALERRGLWTEIPTERSGGDRVVSVAKPRRARDVALCVDDHAAGRSGQTAPSADEARRVASALCPGDVIAAAVLGAAVRLDMAMSQPQAEAIAAAVLLALRPDIEPLLRFGHPREREAAERIAALLAAAGA